MKEMTAGVVKLELPAGWGSRVNDEKDSDAAHEAASVGASFAVGTATRAREGSAGLGVIGEAIVNLVRLWTRTGPDAEDACVLLQAITGAMIGG
jgi:hypothetical protein